MVSVSAEVLDGTTTPVVKNTTWTPDNISSNAANGVVWLVGGLTLNNVSASQTVTLNTPVPVNGTINFGYVDASHTGTLTLGQNLTLGTNAALSSQGTINLATYTLSFLSDLSLTNTYTFTDSGTLNGLGNRLTLGSGGLLSVASNKTLTLSNVHVTNFDNAHLTLAASAAFAFSNTILESSAGKIYLPNATPATLAVGTESLFGDVIWSANSSTTTIIQLLDDCTLSGTWTFGTADSQSFIIDLNGHALDCSTAGTISLADYNATSLVIKNGSLINLSGTRLRCAGYTHTTADTIILEDVDLYLSGDLTTGESGLNTKLAFTIQGFTRLISSSSSTSSVPTWTNYGISNFTINAGSRFYIDSKLTYAHLGGASNFIFTDRSSVLQLMGGYFKGMTDGSSNTLTLKKGTLVVDHTAKFTGNTILGSAVSGEALYIEFLPGGSSEIVASTTVTLANPDSLT